MTTIWPSQEMKAMERIKDVRHPFVLSLERFEVVDGRLRILTELADLSLEQRASNVAPKVCPAFPRDELLRYMADAAEALDYLAERHGLQHLDIKPANLLISGDHVKVADFGLVKELASRTQNSMVAGMTPTYSSPEMFDDAPSPQSDQYSLAIVYQEMLTGVLPFPGRTAAQLANQHLRSQPQLDGTVRNRSAAVARALAKNPAERFPSCRAFVQASSTRPIRLRVRPPPPATARADKPRYRTVLLVCPPRRCRDRTSGNGRMLRGQRRAGYAADGSATARDDRHEGGAQDRRHGGAQGRHCRCGRPRRCCGTSTRRSPRSTLPSAELAFEFLPGFATCWLVATIATLFGRGDDRDRHRSRRT